ncbi:hypothetical protein AB0I49_07625 [Streptomyces sp. NPDC050617]|uniref:hypothetical protein n=1 Tax=Streptomyces sp. NPDC050617 TaxID=3154628 RepID=UPI0034174BEB
MKPADDSTPAARSQAHVRVVSADRAAAWRVAEIGLVSSDQRRSGWADGAGGWM